MVKYFIFEDELERIASIKAEVISDEEEHELLKEFVSDILKGAGLKKREVAKFWEREERNFRAEYKV